MSGTVARSLGEMGDAIVGTANVNFDAGTLFIDGTNNRVGIGTATPVTQLQINAQDGILLGASGANSSLRIGSAFNGESTVEILYNRSTGATSISQGNTGSTLNERMRIDSSGRVTMPSQPMFMGSPTNDYSTGGMPTGVIPFTALYNNGSHYNAGTSRFTAPVTGWYRTTWGGLTLAGTVISLQVNGTRVYNGNHFNVATPTYITMTQTVLRTLNAGDFLTIEGWNGGGYFRDWYLWSVELVA